MKVVVAFLGAALVLAIGTATRAEDSGDLGVAKSWLSAAVRDGAALESTTAFPFSYRTTNKVKHCEGVVRNPSVFAKWAACFQKGQKLLLDEVRVGGDLRMAAARDAEPKALRALAKKTPGDGRWVHAFINGDGVSFTFLFRVTGTNGAGKVTAVLLEEEVENG
jgi:hypothetical protein